MGSSVFGRVILAQEDYDYLWYSICGRSHTTNAQFFCEEEGIFPTNVFEKFPSKNA
jgi:hypothetical protein